MIIKTLRYIVIFSFYSFQLTACSLSKSEPISGQNQISVPIGGNSWIKNGTTEKITEHGLIEWSSPEAILETYVRFAKTGKINLALNAHLSEPNSIKVTIGNKSEIFKLDGTVNGFYSAGEWAIKDTGYVKIAIQGVSKIANTYAELKSLVMQGSAIDENTLYVKDNTGNFFYWGRRGPSVHLNYTVPENENMEWYYNEVTVPNGEDVIGSYFMANGFGEGYFGMQVNSEKERRILFSVWSPFQTDDPKSIPLDKRIILKAKGTTVYAGEFGNEGAGGQSYLRYNWKAGNTYRFLLNGKPTGDSTTTYSAYFFAPELNEWQLIASFQRPKTVTYLKRFHSFLENFTPETGDVGRQVNFGNQWVCNSVGKWTELTEAKFTADATARKGYRMDYAGGSNQAQFFLKNCGFFSDYSAINRVFQRNAIGQKPKLDLKAIEKLAHSN